MGYGVSINLKRYEQVTSFSSFALLNGAAVYLNDPSEKPCSYLSFSVMPLRSKLLYLSAEIFILRPFQNFLDIDAFGNKKYTYSSVLCKPSVLKHTKLLFHFFSYALQNVSVIHGK